MQYVLVSNFGATLVNFLVKAWLLGHLNMILKMINFNLSTTVQWERYGAFLKLRLHLGWVGGQKNM